MPRRKTNGQWRWTPEGHHIFATEHCSRGHVQCAELGNPRCLQPDKKAPRGKPFGKDGDERRKQDAAAGNKKDPRDAAIACKRPQDNSAELRHQKTRWHMDKMPGKTSAAERSWEEFQAAEQALYDAQNPDERETKDMTANTEGHKAGDSCPSCKTGRLQIRTGRFGAFIGCDAYPVCRFSRSLSKDEQNKIPQGELGDLTGKHADDTTDPAALGEGGTGQPGEQAGEGEGEGEGEGQGEGEGEGKGKGGGDEDPITKRIREIAREEDATVVEAVAEALQTLQKQIAEGGLASKVEVVVKQNGDETRAKLDGNPHPLLDRVLFKALRGQNIMLVGPAGCGKTYLAHQLAKVLPTNAALPGEDGTGRYFATVSCTAGMTESQLTGRYIPTGERGVYLRAEFVRCYEDGGVFLLDEFDAADSNVVLVLNQALANGRLPLPNRVDNPVAKKHPDFVLIVACNTYGKGADRQYVGRNQMDAATLDRFVGGVVSMDYDRALEEKLTVAKLGKEKATPVLAAWWGVRDKVAALKLRQVVSTRGLLAVVDMLATGEHAKPANAIRDALEAWPSEDRVKVGVAA